MLLQPALLPFGAGFNLLCVIDHMQLSAVLFGTALLSFPLAQLIAERLAAFSWPWLCEGSSSLHYSAVATGFISSAVLSLLLFHISLPDLPARLFFCPDGCLAQAI